MTTSCSNTPDAPPASRQTSSKHPCNREDAKASDGTSNGPKIATIGDWSDIKDPTEYWQELLDSSSAPAIREPNPFTQETIFGKGNTLHELAKPVKKFVTPRRNTAVSVKEWIKTFTRCLEEEELFVDEDTATLRHLIIRLVWTDPTVAFDSGRWINQELISATDTNAWVAVYQMFGCPWKNRNKWFPDNHDETKNQKPKKDITNYFTPTKEKTTFLFS